MLTFVTDIKSPGEPDILAGLETYDLVLGQLDSNNDSLQALRFSAPKGGWNHNELTLYANLLDVGDAYLIPPSETLNLGMACWIGSTEV
ncbi:hypothetical protein [Microbulbifer epialgicus]|uniref:Uncharacterized protein n=1 Tax=Microbulbifer epialgicus TaxID=393907 RepID=A0ABV4NTK5_9GAMM